jgi:antitoxin ParD1/3/4
MSTLNISLPAAMKAFVECQVRSGLYSSASDYVRTLIRAEQHRCAEATAAAQLLDRLTRDQVAAVTPELCAWLQTRLRPADHQARG